MADENEEPKLGLQTPFHEAAASAARKALDEIVKNWEGALAGQDSDAVHDLRVGTRRLRAVLSVYEHAFSPEEFRRAERTMSKLTDALGPARDTDVLIEHLDTALAALNDSDEAEKVGLRAYIDHLKQLRTRQQEVLERAMGKINLEQLDADLATAAKDSTD
jgi:CHAD domain-containing protein